MTTNTLRSLRERAAAATGADRELDADIERAFFGNELDAVPWEYRGKGLWIDLEIDGFNTFEARKFTASLDAAVALVERMLPGCKRGNGIDEAGHFGWIRNDVSKPIFSRAATEAIAIICVLLDALIEQAERKA